MSILILPFTTPEDGCSIGGSADLGVCIRNESSASTPAQRLEVVPDAYFQPSSVDVPSVPAYNEAVIRITLRAYYTQDPQRVPETVTLRLNKTNVSTSTRLQFSFYLKGLESWSPEGLPGAESHDKFNVLLVGLAGSGKSSTVNSALTLVDRKGNAASTQVKTGGGLSQSSVATEGVAIPGLRLVLRDTWGTSSSNYTNESKMFPAMLQGVLPSGWKMGDHDLHDKVEVLREGDNTRFKRKIHAVMFFINAATIATDDIAEMAVIKHNCQQLECLGYEPMVVISKADTIDNTGGFVLDTLGKHTELEKVKAMVAVSLGIAPKNITFGYNYVHQEQRDFQADRATYKLLDMALHRAHDYCKVARPVLSLDQLLAGTVDLEKYRTTNTPASYQNFDWNL